MVNPTQPLFCIHCGYDLRGTPGNICSECGKEFDPKSYRPSLLPWEHNYSIKFKYLRTVLKIVSGKETAIEASLNHNLKRCKRFRLKTCLEVGFVLLLAYFALMAMTEAKPGIVLMRLAREYTPINWNELRFWHKVLHEFFMVMGLGLQGAWGWILPLLAVPILTREWVFSACDAMKKAPKAQALGCYLSALPALMMNWTVVVAGFEFICVVTGVFSPLISNPFRSRAIGITGFAWIGVFLWVMGGIVTLILAAIRSREWINGGEEGKKVSWVGQLTHLAWTYLWRTFFWVIFIPCFVGLSRMVVLGLFRW